MTPPDCPAETDNRHGAETTPIDANSVVTEPAAGVLSG